MRRNNIVQDIFILNYRQILAPVIISFFGLVLLIITGPQGLMPALGIGLVLFTLAMTKMMGTNVVGDNGTLMNLLPISAKVNVGVKVCISGSWVGVICSIPAFLMMKNGGAYIDEWLWNTEQILGTGTTTFYRDLPRYDYAIKANPSAMDVAVGDLMDSGAGLMQIGLMAVLIPITLFFVGCYFAAFVLNTQLYIYPVLRKLPAVVISFIGMIIAGGLALGIFYLLAALEGTGMVSLFWLEVLLAIFFGGASWLLVRNAVKKLESGYDVV